MDKYAVIEIKGKQYKVSEKDEILVGLLGEKEKPEAKVLLLKTKDSLKVGNPDVKGAKVAFKILEALEKGEKVHIQTYKAKSRSRKKIGFRPKYTRLQVTKITS